MTSSLDTLNLPELVFMVKEGNLLGGGLTLAVLTDAFGKVQACPAALGAVVWCVTRVCHFLCGTR